MTLRLNELSVPFSLSPSPGSNWSVDGDAGSLLVTAAAHSDIFIDPGDGAQLNAESLLNAATLLGVPPEGDFQFSARVRVDFESTFDAGVLLLWVDERHWAKLCFEFSPDREPMVVSVVTRGVADDANAFVVDGGPVWLRVARIDRAFAYHASTDGKKWRMIRFFVIDGADASTQIGFEAQSPTGRGAPCVLTMYVSSTSVSKTSATARKPTEVLARPPLPCSCLATSPASPEARGTGARADGTRRWHGEGQ